MNINPLTAIDFYKTDHRRQYPEGTEMVYSNLTARSAKLKNLPDSMYHGGTIFFGLQFFIKDFLINSFSDGFFRQPKEKVLAEYKRRMDTSLGKDAIGVEHIAALHDLGYLPIQIRALPEGSFVPIGVPYLTIHNTDKRFFWLTNYLETVLSNYLWKPIVSATTAFGYKKLFLKYAAETGANPAFCDWQGHDFSCRGMSGMQDSALSGAAHLTSFTGTDTVAAIDLCEQFYNIDASKELIGGSVSATEHSVMSLGNKESEIDTFRRLITKIYPSGIVSIVSDTWDFWRVVTEYASILKPEIMARSGKVVFRPDSGNPVDIICGDPDAPYGTPEYYGALRCLYNVFGGTRNAAGFIELDPHIGLIYGDSITPQRAEAILSRMKEMGFASSNIVFGIGSYTYQHVTRDTYGIAVKSTAGIVNGEVRSIFKDPITDAGKMKKSAKGFLKVVLEGGGDECKYVLKDQQQRIDESDSLLEVVFENGKLLKECTLSDIRGLVKNTNIKG